MKNLPLNSCTPVPRGGTTARVMRNSRTNLFSIEEETVRREGKGRRCSFGDEIHSIPCHPYHSVFYAAFFRF